MKDPFDQWWEWAEKPLDSPPTIPAEIHEAVMALFEPHRPARTILAMLLIAALTIIWNLLGHR